jgi:hypothetical protein
VTLRGFFGYQIEAQTTAGADASFSGSNVGTKTHFLIQELIGDAELVSDRSIP